MLISGILQPINFPEGFSRYLLGKGIRMVEYKESLAKPLRDKIVSNAEHVAKENDLEIEYISSPRSFRKEERIPVWYIYSKLWKPAPATRQYLIEKQERRTLSIEMVSAFITTSISSTLIWASATSECPLGYP